MLPLDPRVLGSVPGRPPITPGGPSNETTAVGAVIIDAPQRALAALAVLYLGEEDPGTLAEKSMTWRKVQRLPFGHQRHLSGRHVEQAELARSHSRDPDRVKAADHQRATRRAPTLNQRKPPEGCNHRPRPPRATYGRCRRHATRGASTTCPPGRTFSPQASVRLPLPCSGTWGRHRR